MSSLVPLTPFTLVLTLTFDSLHVGAFFARILAVVGATSISDLESAIPLLDKNLVNGVKVGPRLTAYLTALFARESFQEVYGEGLH